MTAAPTSAKMAPWPLERRVDACVRGPMGAGLSYEDGRVIERRDSDGNVVWYQLVTPSAPGAVMNEVYRSVVADADADAAIDDVISTYRALGKPVKWCVGPWTQPTDFGARLTSRGFASRDVRGMGISTSVDVAAPAHLRIVEARARTELEEHIDVSYRGWDVSTPADQRAAEIDRFADAVAAGAARMFTIVDGERAIGTGAMFLRDRFAYLLASQVLDEARGRGAYRALVAARLAWLQAHGYEYAVTHAREATSAPMLEHLGFETLFRYTCFTLD